MSDTVYVNSGVQSEANGNLIDAASVTTASGRCGVVLGSGSSSGPTEVAVLAGGQAAVAKGNISYPLAAWGNACCVTSRCHPNMRHVLGSVGGAALPKSCAPFDLLRRIAAFAALLIGLSEPCGALAQIAMAPDGQSVMRQTALSMIPQVSTDTTPIAIDYQGVHFLIPRNYLVSLSNWRGGRQSIVELRVSLPDMKPITAEDAPCFRDDPNDRPSTCEPLTFYFSGTMDGPDADTILDRRRDLFLNQIPDDSPEGFDRYDYGAKSVGMQVFTTLKNGRRFMFTCQRSGISPKTSLCTPDADRTNSKVWVRYFLPFRLLRNAIDIDTGVLGLIDSFASMPKEP